MPMLRRPLGTQCRVGALPGRSIMIAVHIRIADHSKTSLAKHSWHLHLSGWATSKAFQGLHQEQSWTRVKARTSGLHALRCDVGWWYFTKSQKSNRAPHHMQRLGSHAAYDTMSEPANRSQPGIHCIFKQCPWTALVQRIE